MNVRPTICSINKKSKYRGLLIEVNTCERASVDNNCHIKVSLSPKWQTFAQVAFPDSGIQIFAIGHLYAREANTFNVHTTLSRLGKIYSQKGVEAVKMAIGGGMFALFIIDQAQQKIHAMCDLLACMPLFYSAKTDLISLGTSQFDFKFGNQLSRQACLEYLTYGYLPFSDSLFTEIKRIGPGQIISIDARATVIERITDIQLPTYPPLNERVHDLGAATREINRVLERFFSRLDDNPLAVGLSGGYDSRLIAAFTQKHKPQLVTFNYPGSREVDTARRVAGLLGNATNVFEIPAEAPSLFNEDFCFGMQTLDSFESSHVFALLDALLENNPSYVIDGFLGNEVIGSHFFYKLVGGMESTMRVLMLHDNYDEKIRQTRDYIDVCQSGYGRAINLSGITGESFSGLPGKSKLEQFVDQQANNCHTHADMLELLVYRMRSSRVIACGPITCLRKVNTLSPFYDNDVMTTCMSIDKRLRAGERLYNSLWRFRFPDFADIPKESTGGRPSQSDYAYRLTHFRNAILRRLARYAPSTQKTGKAGGDISNFVTQYCNHPANRDYFDQVCEQSKSLLHEHGLGQFLSLSLEDDFSRKLYLRFISLAALLAESD